MVHIQVGFAVCLYGVGPHISVHSSSQAGLLAGSECSGIGGLLHVAGVSHENVRYHVYTAQGNLERITTSETKTSHTLTSPLPVSSMTQIKKTYHRPLYLQPYVQVPPFKLSHSEEHNHPSHLPTTKLSIKPFSQPSQEYETTLTMAVHTSLLRHSRDIHPMWVKS